MGSLVLETLAKTTVVLSAAALLAWLGRRSPAAHRHLLWVLALGAVLALPAVEALGPGWAVLPWPAAAAGHDRAAAGGAATAAPVSRATPATPPLEERRPAQATVALDVSGSGRTPGGSSRRLPPAGWIVAGWLAGCAVVVAGLVVVRRRLTRLAARATAVTAPEWLGLLASLGAELGVRRTVTLLTVSGPAMPMTWGTRRPVVLLPAEVFDWTPERRRDVLLHELAHVQRRDCLTQLLGLSACAVYWFHPLVWMATARLRVERERACDDRVLAAGSKPSAYATHLLEIARTLRLGPAKALATLAMARPSQLAGRLLGVLDPARRRDALTRRASLAGAGIAACIVLPLAAMRPAGAPAARPLAATGPAAQPAPRSRTDTLRRRAALHVPAVSDTGWCSGDESRSVNTSHTSSNGDHRIVLQYEAGRCVTELRADGAFTFNSDFTDIAAISPGGSVVVERRSDITRRLELRPGGGKTGETVARRWFVSGQERPYDATARAWLADVLTDLLRHTGYAATARSHWLLQTRGVAGVFDEIAQLSGDYTRRVYYQALVADGHLDASQVARVVAQAGREISSDYDLAELLVLVAQQYPLDEPTRSAFVTAARRIGSDYDRRRVLTVVLAGKNLSDDLASAVLGAAAGIGSDYDLAQILVVLIRKHPVTAGMSPAFFKAVDGIESSYDRRRVLDALLTVRPELAPHQVAAVLRAAGAIGSDYDRAEILVEVAKARPLEDALRTPFFAAADGIGSAYDHARVLKAVLTQSPLTAAVVDALLASSRTIGSDHDRAEVLVALARRGPLTAAQRRAFVAAAEGIGSEYDRNRVLAALGETVPLD